MDILHAVHAYISILHACMHLCIRLFVSAFCIYLQVYFIVCRCACVDVCKWVALVWFGCGDKQVPSARSRRSRKRWNQGNYCRSTGQGHCGGQGLVALLTSCSSDCTFLATFCAIRINKIPNGGSCLEIRIKFWRRPAVFSGKHKNEFCLPFCRVSWITFIRLLQPLFQPCSHSFLTSLLFT